MCVLDEQVALIVQVSASLSSIGAATSGLVQSTSICVRLKRHQTYVLMELRSSAGYKDKERLQGRWDVTGRRGAHPFWREAPLGSSGLVHPPSQDLPVPLLCLCLWRNVGLSCGCKCLFLHPSQTSAGCV